jgi:hypothetical protein
VIVTEPYPVTVEVFAPSFCVCPELPETVEAIGLPDVDRV